MSEKSKIKKQSIFLLLALCAGIVFCFASMVRADDDFTFKWILPLEYYKGTDFSEGRAWVCREKDGPWTLIDARGNILKEGFEARSIGTYIDGFAKLELVGKSSSQTSYVNLSGDLVFPSDTFKGGATSARGGLFSKRENGLYGYIDIKGEWVIPPIYDFTFFFSDGLAPVKKGGKWRFVDKNGDMPFDFAFDEVEVIVFMHGICVIEKNGLYGLIDKNGRIIAEPIYESYCSPWSEPIGMVKGGKIGFIDSKGNIIIDFKFPIDLKINNGHIVKFACFNDERAVVSSPTGKREYQIIDKLGRVVFSINGPNKLFTTYFEGGFMTGVQDGEITIWDVNGRHYSLASYLGTNVAIFPSPDRVFRVWDYKNGKTGYFTITDRSYFRVPNQ
jgi:hypothetical protein